MKNLVKNGDFSRGNKLFTSDYVFVDGKPGTQPDAGSSYDVDRTPNHAAGAWPDWADFGDHTTGDGKMLLANSGPGDAWRQDVALAAGKDYTFSLWARAIDDGSSGTGSLPVLQFFADGQAVGATLTLTGTSSDGWHQLTFSYTPTATTSVVSIQNLTTDSAYNDFALDDISITKGAPSAALHPDAFAVAHLDAHPAFATVIHGLDHHIIA